MGPLDLELRVEIELSELDRETTAEEIAARVNQPPYTTPVSFSEVEEKLQLLVRKKRAVQLPNGKYKPLW